MTSILQPSSVSVAIVIVLAASYIALQIGKAAGPVIGLMDHPNWRKKHGSGIPTTGSFALLVSLALFALWYLNDADMKVILMGAGLFYLLGLVDDITPLPATLKLVYQILVTAFVSIETELTAFSPAFLHNADTFGVATIAAPLSAIVLTVLVSNALNLIDGHDGLAAGITIFTLLAMVPIFGSDFNKQTTLISIFIILPMAIFWVQNSGLIGRKLFLGDSGSLTLGYLISWLIIYQISEPTAAIPSHNHLSYFLWLVFVPCVDATAVLLHRIWIGKPMFQPDRTHIHHLLTNAGIDRIAVMVLLLWLHAAFIGCGWLVMQHMPQWSYQILAMTALAYVVITHQYRSRAIVEQVTEQV